MAKKSGLSGGVFGANTRTAATRVGDMVYVKHDRFIGRSLGAYGEWAQIEIDALLRYVAPGDFVLDVGANIGFHALSFARKVGRSGTVWAFEPDPVNGLLLRHNITQAGLDEVVIPFDLAVSDRLGICRFRTVPISAPDNFGHTAVDPVEGDYPRICLPLDALAIDRAPALIKIDIEGHEAPALSGMSELIERYRPVLSIEADGPEEVEANGALAAALGYDVYSLVVNAYNAANFAENATDIWNGHGRCANLLCLVPGKHALPEGLDLVRRAEPERQVITHLGKSVGAAYSALPVDADRSGELPVKHGLSEARSDVRRFVSGFLRTTYGKLDPVADAALVDSALDFLAATGAPAEGLALQRLIIAGVESFAETLGSRLKAEELVAVTAERDQLCNEVLELRASMVRVCAESEEREAAHRLALEDVSSRLLAADAAAARLAAELAQQGDAARREVSEAHNRAAEAEARIAALSSEKADAESSLAQIVAEREQRDSELAAIRRQAEEDKAELTEKLSSAEEAAGRLSAEIAQCHEDKRELAAAIAAAEARIAALSSEKADAESSLAQIVAEREQRDSELAAIRRQAEEDKAELTEKLSSAEEAARQWSAEIDRFNQEKQELAAAVAAMESERGELLFQLSEAQERLALQAQQLRHLRSAKT